MRQTHPIRYFTTVLQPDGSVFIPRSGLGRLHGVGPSRSRESFYFVLAMVVLLPIGLLAGVARSQRRDPSPAWVILVAALASTVIVVFRIRGFLRVRSHADEGVVIDASAKTLTLRWRDHKTREVRARTEPLLPESLALAPLTLEPDGIALHKHRWTIHVAFSDADALIGCVKSPDDAEVLARTLEAVSGVTIQRDGAPMTVGMSAMTHWV